tara:strand:+ start:2398 stop:3195 length:798 start_codon:yes stop_codon:yes gene_type:complete
MEAVHTPKQKRDEMGDFSQYGELSKVNQTESFAQYGVLSEEKASKGLMSPTIDSIIEEDYTQKLLDRIAYGEGARQDLLTKQEGFGTTEYDLVLGYGDFGKPNKPISDMTMDELYKYQTAMLKNPNNNLNSSAVGKYQIIRTTLFGKGGSAEKPKPGSLAYKLKLKSTDKYDAKMQEKLGMELLNRAGYQDFVNDKKSATSFQNRLADIFASVARRDTNKSKYGQRTATFTEDLKPLFALQKSQPYRPNQELTVSIRPRARPENL